MGDVVELDSAKRARRVDMGLKSIATDFCGLSGFRVEVIDETVVLHVGELELYWSADEAGKIGDLLKNGAGEARQGNNG